ncbi:hypothetical protein [Haloactinomyces albus]|uniref:Excreted virulence factor EspC, type VII ESX diderm n=1 Tax=Haloactinomyces albus TaxID=1352928 RepID=A0AAE3ZBZ9_9ACTN|nr:hypothetical protein [Haloactinomyces albus]MDR7301055.1 hypothetical protein [Haloactinomyces albus]
MPDFTVDIGALDAMEKNLNRAEENLGSALKAMEDIGPDSIGPDFLDEACAQFREDWQRGIGEIGDCVDKITTGLGDAKKTYTELETALRDGFTKMHEAVSSGTAGAPEPPTAKPAPTGGAQ